MSIALDPHYVKEKVCFIIKNAPFETVTQYIVIDIIKELSHVSPPQPVIVVGTHLFLCPLYADKAAPYPAYMTKHHTQNAYPKLAPSIHIVDGAPAYHGH